MQEMCRVIPRGCCPNCGNSQFIVAESSLDVYLTNRYGEVIDSREMNHTIIGQCIKCHNRYEMYPVVNGFIPLTPFRKFMYERAYYDPEDEIETYPSIPNPMEKKNENTVQ